MLFLTVPGGTASLRRGLFMGSPGMYIRGFVKGGDIRKGRGVFGAYVELMLDHKGLSSVFVRTTTCRVKTFLQSDEVLSGLHYYQSQNETWVLRLELRLGSDT